MANIGAILLGISVAFADNGCGETPRPFVVKKRIGAAAPAVAQRPNYDTFDHQAFDCLLRRFVDCRGQVCYQTWQADCAAVIQLQSYLMSLGQVRTDDDKASIQGQLSFYINAYNALVIWGILHEYPTASIQAHNKKSAEYRIFDDLEIWVDGDYLSLNTIEHDVLRKLGDFRIHFALVCAAKGCPRLRCEAYVPHRLEEQLVENSLDFFSSNQRFQICRLTGNVKLSPILKWFREDFGHCDNDVLAAILPYLTCADHDWVCRNPCAAVKYMGYNWALNDQCPTPGVKLGATPYALYAKLEPLLRPILPKKDTQSSSDAHINFEVAAAPTNDSNKPKIPASESKSPSEPMPPKAIEIKSESGRSAEPPPPKAIQIKENFGFAPGRAIRLYGALLPRKVAEPTAGAPAILTAKPLPDTQTR